MRFSWCLGPSPRQPTVVWPRRDAPTADCASGTKQRRYTALSPSNSSIVLLLLVCVDNVLERRDHAFFRFDILMADGPSRRILDQNQLTTWVIGFSDRKITGRFLFTFGMHKQMLSLLESQSSTSEARNRTAYGRKQALQLHFRFFGDTLLGNG